MDLQSINAGSKVISFPRCLLVRLVECLDKHSLSLSVFSGDTGSVTNVPAEESIQLLK